MFFSMDNLVPLGYVGIMFFIFDIDIQIDWPISLNAIVHV